MSIPEIDLPVYACQDCGKKYSKEEYDKMPIAKCDCQRGLKNCLKDVLYPRKHI